MIVQLDIADVTALVPAMRQLDIGFAAVADVMIEDDVLHLAISEEHFDAVQLDVVFVDLEFQPLELAITAADVDRVAVVDEADMAVGEPYPFAGIGSADRKKCGNRSYCYRPKQSSST
jgi:hypothetical protein